MKNKSDKNSGLTRKFSTEDGRSISIKLSKDLGSSPVSTSAEMKKFMDAVNACDAIHMTDDGTDMTITLSMKMDQTYGDFGAVLTLKMHGENAQLPKPIDMEGIFRMFAVGNIGVSVSAIGGLDMNTAQAIAPDESVITKQSMRLESAITKLQGR